MKFFMSMLGLLLLIFIAFMVGYKTDLGPVDEPEEESAGGISNAPQDYMRNVR